MKKAALLSGALVVPSSWTLGTSVGKGVGSTYGLDDKPGSWMGDAIVADSEDECSQHRLVAIAIFYPGRKCYLTAALVHQLSRVAIGTHAVSYRSPA